MPVPIDEGSTKDRRRIDEGSTKDRTGEGDGHGRCNRGADNRIPLVVNRTVEVSRSMLS
jgi:hypothetical protein